MTQRSPAVLEFCWEMTDITVKRNTILERGTAFWQFCASQARMDLSCTLNILLL